MNHYLSCAALIFIATTSHGRADEESITTMVLDAQRAGFEQHDFDKYMTQWADDACFILGRSEQSGKYDHVLNREQIEATRHLRFKGKSPVKIGFENARIRVSNDGAILRVRTSFKFLGGSETMDEVYRLRLTDDGWRVYENRAWPVLSQSGPDTFRFDANTWRMCDARIEALKRNDDPPALANALFVAYRFDEAHEVARKITSEGNPGPTEWALLGQLAIIVGDADGAKVAFDKALSLDPNALVPPYARVRD